MSYRKIDSFRSLFRAHVVVGILFFSVLFVLLAAAHYAEMSFSCQIPHIEQSDLTQCPVSEKEDAAVRWDYRGCTAWVWRLNSRSNGRMVSVPLRSGLVEPEKFCCDILSGNQQKCFDQINIGYFRRLWQKIFPTRAGPLV